MIHVMSDMWRANCVIILCALLPVKLQCKLFLAMILDVFPPTVKLLLLQCFVKTICIISFTYSFLVLTSDGLCSSYNFTRSCIVVFVQFLSFDHCVKNKEHKEGCEGFEILASARDTLPSKQTTICFIHASFTLDEYSICISIHYKNKFNTKIVYDHLEQTFPFAKVEFFWMLSIKTCQTLQQQKSD